MASHKKESDDQQLPPTPAREHPSTYVVQDRSNQDELLRQQIQDQMVTELMGGVLPEQADLTRFSRVLDVGCGTGSWLIEVAKAYPNMKRLGGVDISHKMVTYARAQAEAAGVSDRVEFVVMDALRRLDFPAQSFDLVNQRFGQSYLRKWDWSGLLREFQRVCKPGGVIRVTEGDFVIESSSPALSRLFALLLEAFYQAGHLFIQDKHGITSQLVRLFQQSGIEKVQTQVHTLHYQAGTPTWQRFVDDMKLAFQTNAPFIRKWTRVPDDYEAIYQQMLTEIAQPDFVGTADVLTVWGINSARHISKIPVRD